VLPLLAQGCTNLQIAEALCITERTARFHIGSILKKLGARNRTEAATLMLKNGRRGVKTGV
jgi:DNA-binding NarL/FixJ family response regulator